LLSALGLPPAKMLQCNFISKIKKKTQKHRGNPSAQFRFGVLRVFKGNSLSALGLPPAKMQQRNFIIEIQKKTSKT